MKTIHYGYKPDKPDDRDKIFKLNYDVKLPPSVDLRPFFPPVYAQEELGSCTAQAVAGAIEYEFRRDVGGPTWSPSTLMLYYEGRVAEGSVEEDKGLDTRSAVKAAAKVGVCPTEMWPYVIGRFSDKPPKDCYKKAAENRVMRYYRLQSSLKAMQTCLAAGWPIIFGVYVFESFYESEKDPKVKLPGTDEPCMGGHAMVAVGYNNRTTSFVVRNSFGPKWGKKGYLYMPYEYLTHPQLCQDMWTIRMT